MASLETFLQQGGEEKYKEAIKINDVDAKSDPENEPYKSKYKAREIFHGIKAEIEELHKETPTDVRLVILAGALDLKLGSNYSETDEFTTGEEHLKSCIERLDECKLDPRACNIVQCSLNELGILWTGRRQPSKALEYLTDAKKLYELYSKEVSHACWTVNELFTKICAVEDDDGTTDKERTANFEGTFTHTLYYLAQVYAQLDDSSKSAEYCHNTLRRQLDSKTYEPCDWALNAATLSQFYLTKSDFRLARHCLASASRILEEFGPKPESLRVDPDESESNTELLTREKLPQSWAGLFRCWTKYGLCLLEYSQEKLYANLANFDSDETNSATDSITAEELSESEKSNKEIMFDLELTSIEEEITDKRALVFEDARKVFLAVQKWLNCAKEFYSLNGHCTDHVELVQDHSRLFKLLAFFETDQERQCRMHKRRIDMLEATVRELNPQYYLLLCRQVHYELAETFSGMLDIKLAILEGQGSTPSQHAVNKINSLCQSSIKYYQIYLDSLQDPKTKSMPSKLEDDDERPALIANFCLGRLFSKFIHFEIPVRLANLKRSLDHYGFLVDYCKRNPSATEKVKTERELCEEMLVLLPTKMERIRNQAN